MKKVIKLTEAELTNLIKKVIEEQTQDKLTPVSKPSGTGKLKTISNTVSKTDSESWFGSFPCLNDVPQTKKPMVNGKIILKTGANGEQHTLLPESGKNDPSYKYVEQYKPVNNYVGQIQGGGVYYCSSEAYAKGFGPQIMKMK